MDVLDPCTVLLGSSRGQCLAPAPDSGEQTLLACTNLGYFLEGAVFSGCPGSQGGWMIIALVFGVAHGEGSGSRSGSLLSAADAAFRGLLGPWGRLVLKVVLSVRAPAESQVSSEPSTAVELAAFFLVICSFCRVRHQWEICHFFPLSDA